MCFFQLELTALLALTFFIVKFLLVGLLLNGGVSACEFSDRHLLDALGAQLLIQIERLLNQEIVLVFPVRGTGNWLNWLHSGAGMLAETWSFWLPWAQLLTGAALVEWTSKFVIVFIDIVINGNNNFGLFFWLWGFQLDRVRGRRGSLLARALLLRLLLDRVYFIVHLCKHTHYFPHCSIAYFIWLLLDNLRRWFVASCASYLVKKHCLTTPQQPLSVKHISAGLHGISGCKLHIWSAPHFFKKIRPCFVNQNFKLHCLLVHQLIKFKHGFVLWFLFL